MHSPSFGGAVVYIDWCITIVGRYKSIFLIKSNVYIEGKRHDAGMLRMSGWLESLQTHCNTAAGEPLCIYGDLPTLSEGTFKHPTRMQI